MAVCDPSSVLHAHPWFYLRRNAPSLLSKVAVRAVPPLRSLNNDRAKHWVRLRQSSSYRKEQSRVLVIGRDLVLELRPHVDIRVVVATSSEAAPADLQDRLALVSTSLMVKVTGMRTFPVDCLIAEVAVPSDHFHGGAMLSKSGPKQLVLAGVQDPGNMGALLRTALAFGWDDVVLLPGCCDPFNDKCLRASRGAALRLHLYSCTAHELVQSWHDRQPFVATISDDASLGLSAAGSTTSKALVLGPENGCICPELLEVCMPVTVPMKPGSLDSLNVAVAGGILMFMLGQS